MKNAKDRLVFPLDMPSLDQALSLVTLLSDLVGVFKIGLELFVAEGPQAIDQVRRKAPEAAIFLDLKLHDIPETVYRATRRIAAQGIAYTTIHCGDSSDMLEAAVKAAGGSLRLLGVTVLTSVTSADLRQAGYVDDLAGDVQRLVLKKARLAQSTGFAGVICSAQEAKTIKTRCGQSFLTVTPGIRLSDRSTAPDDQKRVSTPAAAIRNGSDLLVVGRPIRDAADPRQSALHILKAVQAGLNLA